MVSPWLRLEETPFCAFLLPQTPSTPPSSPPESYQLQLHRDSGKTAGTWGCVDLQSAVVGFADVVCRAAERTGAEAVAAHTLAAGQEGFVRECLEHWEPRKQGEKGHRAGETWCNGVRSAQVSGDTPTPHSKASTAADVGVMIG